MPQSSKTAARCIRPQTVNELLALAKAYESNSENRGCLARDAADLLDELAPWWLAPEALQLVAGAPRESSDRRFAELAKTVHPEPGLALVTCVWREADVPAIHANGCALLRPGPVLPVRWYPGRRHDETLPRGLLGVADDVLREFAVERGFGSDGRSPETFGLGWISSLAGRIDARYLTVEADSAFFALAAALYLARHAPDAPSNPRIWVSAAWDRNDRYVRRVDGIEYKVATALQFGADKIFVPLGNLDEARATVGKLEPGRAPDTVIAALRTQDTFRNTLKPILVEYRIPPDEGASFEELKEYHRYIAPLDRRRSRTFYETHLFRHIVDICKRRLPDDLRELAERRPVLVAAVSHSDDLIPLAWHVFNCRDLVPVLIGGQNTPAAKQGLAKLKQWGIPTAHSFDFPERGWNRMCTRARELYAYVSKEMDGPVLVDLTPGFKTVSLALLLEGTHHDVSYVYLSHDWLNIPGVREPEPGTQSYERIDPRISA